MRKLRLSLVRIVLALAAAPLAFAQTTTQLTGQNTIIGTIQVSTQYESYVQAQLINCPTQHPRVIIAGALASIVVQTNSAPFFPDASGNIRGFLYPNDILSCDGTVGHSAWRFTFIQNGVPTGQTEDFIITSSNNPFNITTNIPITQLPAPFLPGQDFHFRNLILDGALLAQTVEAGTFVWQTPPPPCALGFAVGGFNTNFKPLCLPVSEIVNAVALNAFADQDIIQPAGTHLKVSNFQIPGPADTNVWTTTALDNVNPISSWGVGAPPALLCGSSANNGNEFFRLDTLSTFRCVNGAWQSASSGVITFNGRPGVVIPVAGDYNFSQIGGTVGVGQLGGTYNINISGNAQTAGFATTAGSANTAAIATAAQTATTASTAAALSGTPTQCGASQVAKGIAANGNASCTSSGAVQAARLTSGICTTGGTAFAACANAVLNWPSAWADTNYAASCTGVTMTGNITQLWITSRTTTAIATSMVNGDGNGAVASTFTEIDCVGIHP